MAHLFLAGKISAPDDLPQGGRTPRSVVVTTHVPHVNEAQLSAAAGGAETSCSRCTAPFGVVVLIAGVVVTAVAYAFNSHGSVISVLGLALLATGLLLLAASAFCWRRRSRAHGRDRRRESQTALMASQGYCRA
ncbi:transmembrane protein 100-like [Perca flavescens]|uniref:transmembrane protein 100-like n=1 Tax=Perca flavescens TaxID=8167 RepID=UPI00106E6F42|nr:transmembrane protein 100-like [Perca flavescens]